MIQERANVARYLGAAGGIGQSGTPPPRGETACQRSIGRGGFRGRPPEQPREGGLTSESPSGRRSEKLVRRDADAAALRMGSRNSKAGFASSIAAAGRRTSECDLRFVALSWSRLATIRS